MRAVTLSHFNVGMCKFSKRKKLILLQGINIRNAVLSYNCSVAFPVNAENRHFFACSVHSLALLFHIKWQPNILSFAVCINFLFALLLFCISDEKDIDSEHNNQLKEKSIA